MLEEENYIFIDKNTDIETFQLPISSISTGYEYIGTFSEGLATIKKNSK